MSARQIRIVKVGGSLFDLPDLGDRLRQWLSRQSPAHHVLLAGGGSLVDEVRRWHALRPLDEAAAHWMCVDLLTVSAHLLHARLPEIPLIEDDRLLCQRVGERDCTIFVPATWMRYGEPKLPGTPLPQTWEVTSDSIAARLAIALGAEELVMMKSRLPEKDPAGGIPAFSDAGYVDSMLGRLLGELPAVRFVSLRTDSPTELTVNGLGSKP
jgi:aspartokinase-like uncharacterized kinase